MRYEWPCSLTPADMQDMITLINEVAAHEATLGFNDPLSEEDGMLLMRAFGAELSRGTVELLTVRTDQGTIVGMVTLARAPLPARRHIVEMRRCTIAREHRGTFLLPAWGHAVHKVASMGCDVITLEVRDDGPGRLWERLGFREYGRLPDYARSAGRSVTGHYMYALRSEIVEHHELTGSWLFTTVNSAEPVPR
jgi:hypothetical protein